MKRLLVLVAFLAALLPTAVFAQDGGNTTRGVLFRAGGDVSIPAGETVDSVIVVGGDVRVDGTVHDLLMVINGDATVSGSVGGDVVVVSGSLHLAPTATVKNVSLVRSDLTQDEGATVSGTLNHTTRLPGIGWGLWLFVWGGFTALVLASGLLFAAVGGRQLGEMAELIRRRTGESILAAVILWIAVPAGAVLLLLTVVGIPLGIGVFLFLLPALWFMGYLVSGTALGLLLMRLTHSTARGAHPYLAAVIGLTLLQAAGLVPVLGGFVVLAAGLFGGGVLTYRLWQGWRGRAATPPAAMVPA
jgi:hypothetical protein